MIGFFEEVKECLFYYAGKVEDYAGKCHDVLR